MALNYLVEPADEAGEPEVDRIGVDTSEVVSLHSGARQLPAELEGELAETEGPPGSSGMPPPPPAPAREEVDRAEVVVEVPGGKLTFYEKRCALRYALKVADSTSKGSLGFSSAQEWTTVQLADPNGPKMTSGQNLGRCFSRRQGKRTSRRIVRGA